ncbi:MAG: mechanosensitive ion channel [Taibaiella sp.]|nr:mechanosensitive ion channel [Taibaiella sp.]
MINKPNKNFFSASGKYLFILLLLSLYIDARGQKSHTEIYPHRVRDTIQFKRSVAVKNDLVLSDSALNAIGIDSLLNKVESVHNTLNRINNVTGTGYNTRDIETDLPEIDSNVDIIDENVSLYNRVLDVKNLQMFVVLLNDLQDQLSEWRNTLFKYNKELQEMDAKMTAFRKDTILRQLITDSAFKSLYPDEIKDLKSKWGLAKKSLAATKGNIGQIQARVSSLYFETIDLQNNIEVLLRKMSIRSIGKEYDYLWNIKSTTIGESAKDDQLARKSYLGQRRILCYYFYRNWDDQVWMLLTGLLILFWIYHNFRQVGKRESDEKKAPTAYRYIRKVSVLATLVVLFNIAPFFDIHPPTAYVEIMELLLVIGLTFLLWKNWTKDLFYCWLVIGIFYITFSLVGTLFVPSLGFRVLLLLLNIASVAFGFFWLKILKRHPLIFRGMIRFVSVVYVILNAAAIACNLFGRISLTKIFSVTAIFSLTQIVGLSVFIHIINEAFQLQTSVNKLKGGITARLNFNRLEKLLNRILMLVSICIWIIVFTISLNIYNWLFGKIADFLTTPRKIGSTSFQIGNILLFLAIIYISNLLQQGIGSLYSKTGDTWDPEVKKNGSRLAMTRLILIVIGFLIAIAASGLPLDKITIVLGALGVGIGLGLQSIVNNLVSGVILIFEQPFRIGDYIELGDKRGRVLDIGIRSSKLVMDEGAELIMPNGDLLSGRVINWTLRNDNVRLELPLSVEQGHTFDEIKQIVISVLNKNEHILKTDTSEVLLLGIKEKAMLINVLAWIDDVHNMQTIRSGLLNSVINELAEKGIKMI